MSSWLPTIINLVSGALGGNLAGSIFKKLSMGTMLNSVMGIAGGGLGGWLLSTLGMGDTAAAAASSSMDIGSILSSVAGGGVGGGALMGIVGAIKNAMGGNS